MSRNMDILAPPGRSLDPYGIPDHRDALAVYIRWVRQRHYLLHSNLRPRFTLPVAANTESRYKYDKSWSTDDLLGIGGQFESEAENVGYPHQIDIQD
ncbi:hypothetical protein T440DRAFT_466049 [Plenodomus tracheiphilus IPT5]|uniref:Uncharacterized protein n=1 Tax=Plenodomus tracheiphilus IPT5 TaxID=1408161 RepID=A0A6A7BEA2_9PLEO|nr:hypothetical protein T440DRAFT_466049 [Plenodomus tracheiphilus IPT5]